MALGAAPGNGIAFRINHGDGSIVPCDPSNGPASRGMMTITVTNFGTDGLSAIVALVLLNAAIPLPFGRYTVDYGALKVAAAAGDAHMQHVLNFAQIWPVLLWCHNGLRPRAKGWRFVKLSRLSPSRTQAHRFVRPLFGRRGD